jgi:hypothetical protein
MSIVSWENTMIVNKSKNTLEHYTIDHSNTSPRKKVGSLGTILELYHVFIPLFMLSMAMIELYLLLLAPV